MSNNSRNSLIANFSFLIALYAGVALNVVALKFACAGFVWLLLALYGFAYYSRDRKPRQRPNPVAIERSMDFLVVVALIWDNWYLTTAAYVASVVLVELMYETEPRQTRSDDDLVNRSMKEILPQVQSWLRQRQGLLWACVLLVIAYAYWESSADARAARRATEEKESVGAQATLAGTILAEAVKSCRQIGIRHLPTCASNSGSLVYDLVAKEQAKLALEQKADFDKTCTKHFTPEYCAALLQRAANIAWSSRE